MAFPVLSELELDEIFLKRRQLRRQLLAQDGLRPLRIAVLGGTTTQEMVDLSELLLLGDGFKTEFWQSEYGRFYEDAVLEPTLIADFKPDLVYLHTCSINLKNLPSISTSEGEFAQYVEAEMSRYRAIWSSLERSVGSQIIQNNFELPQQALLGNLDAVSFGGATRFVLEMNRQFALAAAGNPRLTIQDQCSISARVGLNQWFDAERWFSYKIVTTLEGSFALASSFAALVRALYGRSRKLLVLDLDNTLWGGVIGDDGADKIVLGRETPLAEAYTAFQEYCKKLRDRGVLLAVCSKNNEETAKEGFSHPDSVLKLSDFSAFKANWEPKHENILAIAQELSLGVDSFVFVDDNPAERAIVAAQLPMVAVPDVGSEVTGFIAKLEAGRYFEPVTLGKEDLERARLYAQNAERAQVQSQFADYGEYLDSLAMSAEIAPFSPVYIERIAQLTNKSNQFNLTTRRYTQAEMEEAASDGNRIGIYGKLRDRFGDNGLISVVLGSKRDGALHLDLWLMSCRVLKREMEVAMLDEVARHAQAAGLSKLVGYYLPTAKNSMVADHYKKLGFALVESDEAGNTRWELLLDTYTPRSRHIRIEEL